MTMTSDRPDLSSEGAPDIDKRILVNVNRNKYPVVRPTWAFKPGLTDRLVVGRNLTLTLTCRQYGVCLQQLLGNHATVECDAANSMADARAAAAR
jgi:hypothetical protein